LISIAAGGGVDRGLGAYRGGEVDGDGRYMSMLDFDAIVSASRSARETTVVVITEQWALGTRKGFLVVGFWEGGRT
jgi:hypothetical protein